MASVASFFLLSMKYIVIVQMKPPTYCQMDAIQVVLKHFEGLKGDYVAQVGINVFRI